MDWANFLHIYQPPTQTRDVVEQVAAECYRKLVAILGNHPDAKLTLNVSACLTEQLDAYGLSGVIDGIRELAERGQIELTGTAKYHAILPLIPEDEVRRQIELNTETNRAFFGDAYRPRGFFPPEMAVNRRVLEIVRDMGFEWIIVDAIARDGAIACDGTTGRSIDDACYELAGCPGFTVFFRERTLSHQLATKRIMSGVQFQRAVEPLLDQPGYLLTGTDGEFYGHHVKGQEAVLSVAYKAGTPPTCTISELLERYPERRTAEPLASSWTTWPDELEQGVPYPQWHHPKHKPHKAQWRLTNAVIQLVQSSEKRDGYDEARRLLDQGLHSCQYWWAGCRTAWSTDMITRGADVLLRAAEALDGLRTHKRVLDVQRLHRELHSLVWEWQHAGTHAGVRRAYKAVHPDLFADDKDDEDAAEHVPHAVDASDPG
jgi:predicted glycosyl hydrolase (DUF1957 family)